MHCNLQEYVILLYYKYKNIRQERALRTIYDIAKIAGVSASSVSRVVNGKPGVNRATREKIQELLKQHNYVPDTNAHNLVT